VKIRLKVLLGTGLVALARNLGVALMLLKLFSKTAQIPIIVEFELIHIYDSGHYELACVMNAPKPAF